MSGHYINKQLETSGRGFSDIYNNIKNKLQSLHQGLKDKKYAS
jgi:hypothetical protein